ncbi:glycosyltransferase [Pseudoxanthomonas sp. J35]|uniref:glycosyltransferase family 4 protein n=1 Tax=Pseudoxanthomonas sp. J35 TaxID=935852 RepID=UPI0009FD45E2|nr:glycosyltransferase [Pseudoxanthomonas sp. J35]
MERLNYRVALALSRHFRLVVVGPEGCTASLPPEVEVHQVPTGSLARFLLGATRATWSAASQPATVVLAGSGLTAPIAFMASLRCGARSAAYVHGLDLVTRHPIYRLLWLPFLRRLALAITNSANTATIARRLGVAGGNIQIVHPGTNLPGCDNIDGGRRFRLEFGLGQDPVLLSVGRLTERKGLVEFVQRCLPAISKTHPRVRLVIIGDNAPNALTRSSMDLQARLQEAICQAGVRNNVVILGSCSDEILSLAYAAADLHIFPVRELPGDVEGFGMVAVEAAAHGLPTIAFATGGVPDAVADGVSGRLVPAGDYDTFTRLITELLAQDRDSLSTSSRQFASQFSWDRFYDQLRTTLDPHSPHS